MTSLAPILRRKATEVAKAPGEEIACILRADLDHSRNLKANKCLDQRMEGVLFVLMNYVDGNSTKVRD